MRSVPPRKWKSRIRDMKEAVDKAMQYCHNVPSEAAFSAEQKTVDACIRNFQILGDAAAKVPESVRRQIKEVAWKEIRGMRNLLVHEYFGVSPSILWNTIQNDLPSLQKNLDRVSSRLESTTHPWRICPPGEYYVRESKVSRHQREGALVSEHLRRDHCREHKRTFVDILTPQETTDIAEIFFSSLSGSPTADDLDFGSAGIKYDHLIRGWTKYWNEVFKPEPPLEPNLVKALIASESSFNPNSGKASKGRAKGLMQLMPLTVKALGGYRNELKDHLFQIDGAEVLDPGLNISAGIRWLFQKRITAARRLKREATWIEAVAEYKDYLRRKPKKPKTTHEGMDTFEKNLRRLNDKLEKNSK